MKNKERILEKVEEYLKKYQDDDSIYYKELKKSYEEYKALDLKDTVTNELYIKHLNETCDFIKSKKNANKIIFTLITFSVFIIILSSFTTIKYYNLAKNLNANILIRNGSTALNVNYGDTSKFDINTISDEASYMNLDPLTFTISATNKNNKIEKIHYDVYLIEQNDDVSEDDLLSKDAFLYNISTNSKESGIKSLKNATSVKNKLLLFSGEMISDKEEELELRMWIDSNTDIDYIYKKYKFKLYVEGYVI